MGRRLFGVGLAIALSFGGIAHADVERGDKGQDVVEVQYTLRALGYSLAVDGSFGAQTEKAVRHYQRANRLVVDGIVGPATQASLSGAVRVAPPTDPGPPANLSGCAEMRWFMAKGGLPDDPFTYYGMRESGCDNAAKPSIPAAACCRGWFAIHKGNITAPGYKAGAAACGIRTEADYYGTSAEQKTASVCFAKVLWDYYQANGGPNPWRM